MRAPAEMVGIVKMKAELWWGFLVLYLSTPAVLGQTGDKAQNQMLHLYRVLHSLTLPKLTADDQPEQRLVLQFPGKILNLHDYYPGDEYVNSLRSPDPEARRVEIPPRVQENMFRLSDALPAVNPFGGAETGEQLSIVYKTLLQGMVVRGMEALEKDRKVKHREAREALSTVVTDPNRASVSTTVLSLYRTYRSKYDDAKRHMEETITMKRRELPAREFEEWFQNNYPTLNSNAEGAYLEWLVFGKKVEVESWWVQLDSASPGLELLDATSSLRAAGVTSLDRSQMVYPVQFLPSDWYRYINETVLPMSREQIELRIGELEGQRLLIINTRSFSPSDVCFETLNDTRAEKTIADEMNKKRLSDAALALSKAKCSCIAAASGKPDSPRSNITECINYERNLTEAIRATAETGKATTDLAEINSLLNPGEDTATEQILASLQDELIELKALLPTAPSSSPDESVFAHREPYDPNDKWLTFEYSSKKSSDQEFQSSQYSRYQNSASSYSSTASASWWGKSSSGSYDYAHDSSNAQGASAGATAFKSLSEAEVTVRGKILKVSISRPWFRADLFKNTRLALRDAEAKVSPGPLSETDFIERAGSFRLPQFVTGFLLARGIEMQFDGVNKDTSRVVMASSQVSSSTSYSGSGGWGPFSFSGKSEYASQSQSRVRRSASFQASSSTTGLKIKIPGVQIIGYFTQVVNKFPISN